MWGVCRWQMALRTGRKDSKSASADAMVGREPFASLIGFADFTSEFQRRPLQNATVEKPGHLPVSARRCRRALGQWSNGAMEPPSAHTLRQSLGRPKYFVFIRMQTWSTHTSATALHPT